MSFNSSIATFYILAHLCLNALMKVSGWNRSLRPTPSLSRAFACTLYTHLQRAKPFLLTMRNQLAGFSGPSHCFSQEDGTALDISCVASACILGVSIAYPCSTFYIEEMLSSTLDKISNAHCISIYTKTSTGSADLKPDLEICTCLYTSGLNWFFHSEINGPSDSVHRSLSKRSFSALTADKDFS